MTMKAKPILTKRLLTFKLKARNTLCSMVSTEPLQPRPITLTLTYRSSSEGRNQDLTRFPIAIRLLILFIFIPDKYSVSLLPYSCQNFYPQNQNFKPLIQQNPIRTRGDTGTKQEIDRKQVPAKTSSGTYQQESSTVFLLSTICALFSPGKGHGKIADVSFKTDKGTIMKRQIVRFQADICRNGVS